MFKRVAGGSDRVQHDILIIHRRIESLRQQARGQVEVAETPITAAAMETMAGGLPCKRGRAPAAVPAGFVQATAGDTAMVDAARLSMLLDLSFKARTAPAAGRTNIVKAAVGRTPRATAAVETMVGRLCQPGKIPATGSGDPVQRIRWWWTRRGRAGQNRSGSKPRRGGYVDEGCRDGDYDRGYSRKGFNKNLEVPAHAAGWGAAGGSAKKSRERNRSRSRG